MNLAILTHIAKGADHYVPVPFPSLAPFMGRVFIFKPRYPHFATRMRVRLRPVRIEFDIGLDCEAYNARCRLPRDACDESLCLRSGFPARAFDVSRPSGRHHTRTLEPWL